MKKVVSIFLVLLMCFACAACSGDNTGEETTKDTSSSLPPILGVHIRNGDKAGFYALTKSSSYIWNAEYDDNGEMISCDVAEGIFCLDIENICTFTREDAGKSIELKFTGDVKSYKIYSAEKSELDTKEKSEIINEEYFVSENISKITFPESGEIYYVVDVKYAQGEISYGFLLT